MKSRQVMTDIRTRFLNEAQERSGGSPWTQKLPGRPP